MVSPSGGDALEGRAFIKGGSSLAGSLHVLCRVTNPGNKCTMSRAADTRSVDKIVASTDGRRYQGADVVRSKNVQRMQQRASVFRGTPLRFLHSRKVRFTGLGFVLGFVTCGWLNVANRPPPVVVKKVVKKKKPKLTIEELPDEPPTHHAELSGADEAMAARPGEEMKMVLVVNDSLAMSPGEAPIHFRRHLTRRE